MSRLFLVTSVLLCLLLLALSDASAQTSNQVARKFDEFGDALVTDIKARADNFAIELQNIPTAKGFIIVYRSRRDLPGISYRYAYRMRDYVVMTRGIANERVIAVDGGEADCLTQELWIVLPGTAPTPRSDAYQRNFVDTDSTRKFDEISWGSDEGVAAVFPGELEAFSAVLRAEPHAYAYVIAYAQYYVQRGAYEEDGKQKRYVQTYRDPPGTSRRVLTQAKQSLEREFHFPPSRIRLVNGGYRKWGSVELWIVPRGEHAPIPTPNSFPPKRARSRK